MEKTTTVAAYVAKLDPDTRRIAQRIRAIIREVAPSAAEVISYGMPAYKVDGRILIYFSVFKTHIGLYPGRLDSAAFTKMAAKYQSGKSTIRLPLDEPIPYPLIRRTVTFRLAEAKKQQKK